MQPIYENFCKKFIIKHTTLCLLYKLIKYTFTTVLIWKPDHFNMYILSICINIFLYNTFLILSSLAALKSHGICIFAISFLYWHNLIEDLMFVYSIMLKKSTIFIGCTFSRDIFCVYLKVFLYLLTVCCFCL